MRFYCDYCDVYLAHDSQGGRRQHNYGWRHRENVFEFYQRLMEKEQQEFAMMQQQRMAQGYPPLMVAPPYSLPPPEQQDQETKEALETLELGRREWLTKTSYAGAVDTSNSSNSSSRGGSGGGGGGSSGGGSSTFRR